VAYARSPEFGEALLDLANQLAARYPYMDFSDAVAHVFTWLDGRLEREPGFVSAKRFPTLSAFRAYLRQAVWNAARLAERKRQRHEPIEALPADRPIARQELGPEERSSLLGLVGTLQEPHKSIFVRYFLEEEELSSLAAAYGCTEGEVRCLYEEAVDRIAAANKAALRVNRARH
jgi:DNA-directed RNA polymerase specialized sigma24 family protein